MRIRRRLTLYAALIATAGMTLFAVLISGLAARGIETDQAVALSALAARTVETLDGVTLDDLAGRQPLTTVDLTPRPEVGSSAAGDSDEALIGSLDAFVMVASGDGSIVYSTGVVDGAPPRVPAAVIVEALETGSSDAVVRPAQDLELRLAAVSWQPPGGPQSVVVAGQSTAFATQQLRGLNAFLVIAGAITIVVVIIVSWLVVGRALRPLVALAATAEEIGRTGDRERRLPPVPARDEVGRLTASFNGMLDRLATAYVDLEAALDAQRRFVADASHELRTPISTIRTNAEFLRERADATEVDRREALDDIAAEAARMGRLTEELLTLARTEAAHGDVADRPRDRPVDFASIVADVLRQAGRPGGEIVAVPGSGGGQAAVITGDRDELTRLVWILVDNAMRHGRPPIRVETRVTDSTVTLAVADAGPGIPAGDEERIFERFYRADAARSGGGSGLGLAIARAITHAHGGTIRVVGADGEGAVFSVDLPLAR